MAERVFDPEAVEEYRVFLLGLLDQLEGQVVPVLAAGTLSRAPAFGTAPGAADNAAGQYQEFHEATWRHLQYLRGALHGMESALAEIAGGGTDADDEASLAFAATDTGGTGSTGGSADGTGTAFVDASGTAPADGPGLSTDAWTAAFDADASGPPAATISADEVVVTE
ncbi:hypothetical protein GCM10009830_49680 [Glycomyces endophyticus]|uniref:PE domain-containing protein n=1 Tax=Glycomyces endophyticus TaxID=480996 RepID=A0ABN2HZD2_9ACTN